MRQRQSKKWILLEQRISALESLLGDRLSKTEGSPETGAANAKADQRPADVTFVTLDETPGKSFAKQNVSRPTHYWESKGARPKNRDKILTSTPVRSAAARPTFSGQPIKLQNRFECLEQVEPVAPRIKTERTPHWNNKNKVRRQLPASPTTLVVGDLSVKNIGNGTFKVSCLPHASVRETKDSIPQLVSDHRSIDRLVVHCGAADLFKEQITVKKDFNDLFSTLKDLKIPFFISGPIPAPCYRDFAFSRLNCLNTWLSRTCRSNGISFVDNFDRFWRRTVLFKKNSAELSWTGAKVLTDQLVYSIETLGADKRPVSVSTQTQGHFNKPSVPVSVQTEPQTGESTHTDDVAKSLSAQVENNGTHRTRHKLNQLSEQLEDLSQKLAASRSPEIKCSPPCRTGKMPLASPIPPPRSAKKRLSTQEIGNVVSSKPNSPPRCGETQPPASPGNGDKMQSPMESQPSRNDETPSSSPRLRFPETMARLLPYARSTFSTPRHSYQASYADISQGQPHSTPKSKRILPSMTAPKKGKAPQPPVCALEYSSISEDDMVESTV